MKLLTVTVPCYNSAEYMEKCVDSLLVGGERVEIIIINDDASVKVPALCKELKKRFSCFDGDK